MVVYSLEYRDVDGRLEYKLYRYLPSGRVLEEGIRELFPYGNDNYYKSVVKTLEETSLGNFTVKFWQVYRIKEVKI